MVLGSLRPGAAAWLAWGSDLMEREGRLQGVKQEGSNPAVGYRAKYCMRELGGSPRGL